MPRSAARSERRRLEGEPEARGQRVGVFRLTDRVHAVENLGRVQRFTRREVGTDDIERHVRGEPPPEPDIRLGTDVAGVAFCEALTIYRGPATGRVDTRVDVDLLGRRRRVDGQEHAERWGEGVRPSEAQLGATVTIVANEATRLGHDRTAGSVVLVAQADDRAPRGVVARVCVERLVVTDPLAQVVLGLVARAVDTASFDEQRAELEASDGVKVEGALLCLSLPERAATGVGDGQLVTSTPLVEQRGIEAPGAEPPARVEPDGVTIFLEVGRAARVTRGIECPCRVRARACEMNILRVTASLAVRRALGSEVRVDRLDVEPLVHRVLGAHDDSEVVATGPLESRSSSAGAVAAPKLALDDHVGELGLEVRRECRDR